jgi:hypothetical protein
MQKARVLTCWRLKSIYQLGMGKVFETTSITRLDANAYCESRDSDAVWTRLSTIMMADVVKKKGGS